ncbi:MAG: glycine cleavage system protein T [Elusimicrobia bacterium CG08_land_8_20_14_0_20_59_10]|nr:MAG: glycine cleavage system protein T [Elusimicrobia bacterium CG08_land_8_20_14_0_20_59_10]
MSTATTIRRTALNETMRKYGGKMVDFHGWELPIQFAGILKEHAAVRTSAGIFDVSHMGQVFVTGADAFKLLQKTNANDLRKATPGKGVYSHVTNENAGLVDDIIAFCLAPDRYLVIVNATTSTKDFEWFKAQGAKMHVKVENKSDDYSMVAIQGPNVPKMFEPFVPEALKLPRFGIVEKDIMGEHCFVSRTGYTGEDGFEITAPHSIIDKLWEKAMELGKPYGIVPCGLGARDTLRLESGYLLYGQDVDDVHTTYEAGYGWVVSLDKGDFIGRNVLAGQKTDGVKRRLTGLTLTGGVPRPGCKVFVDGKQVGELASATYSPTLKKGIGVGYITPPDLKPGAPLEVEIHGKKVKAEVSRMPFHKGTAFSKNLYTGA